MYVHAQVSREEADKTGRPDYTAKDPDAPCESATLQDGDGPKGDPGRRGRGEDLREGLVKHGVVQQHRVQDLPRRLVRAQNLPRQNGSRQPVDNCRAHGGGGAEGVGDERCPGGRPVPTESPREA